MNNKAALFAGALGGVAPNLFRLGANYASTSPQKIQLIPNFGAMLIFAVLGALVVWVFSGKQFKKSTISRYWVAVFLSSNLITIDRPFDYATTYGARNTGLDFASFFCLCSATIAFPFGCHPYAQPQCR